jgi:hypothetical protein
MDPLRPILVEPGEEEHANWKLAQARERLAELEQRGDWKEAIFAHTPCHRLAALEKYAQDLGDERYWQLVAFVWVEDGSPTAARSQRWLRVLESPRPGRAVMMTDGERSKLGRQSADVRVLRGFHYEGGECGLSWTLCRDVATRFARQGEKRGTQMVAEGHIDRDSIIALLHRVEEAEVIANPEDVRIGAISARRLDRCSRKPPAVGGLAPATNDAQAVGSPRHAAHRRSAARVLQPSRATNGTSLEPGGT